MSPMMGQMLLQEIIPLIIGTITKGRIKPVAGEDAEELTADAIAQAAQIVHSAESAGRQFTPGNVAYFALKNVRFGRRSTYGGRTDVYSAGCMRDGNSQITSLDEPMRVEGDDTDGFSLHDLLADPCEDPASAAGRELDWDVLEGRLDDRSRLMLKETAEGYGGLELAAQLNISPPRVSQLKRELGLKVREILGDDVLATVMAPTAWQRHVGAHRETKACRYARRVA